MRTSPETYEKLESEILEWADADTGRETMTRTMRLKIRSYVLINRAHRDERDRTQRLGEAAARGLKGP